MPKPIRNPPRALKPTAIAGNPHPNTFDPIANIVRIEPKRSTEVIVDRFTIIPITAKNMGTRKWWMPTSDSSIVRDKFVSDSAKPTE